LSESLSRFLRLLVVLLVVLVMGTVGYALIEEWPLLDGLYMTIITISTVGYGEVYQLSTAGKIFSSFLIIMGVGTALYTFTSIVEYLIKGNLRNLIGRGQNMEKSIAKLNKHYIICGYGRVGRIIAERFEAEGNDFVVIDADQSAIDQAKEDFFDLIDRIKSSAQLQI